MLLPATHFKFSRNDYKNQTLKNLAYESLLELATEEGINASGKDEAFGCIFGRDSAITILFALNSYNKKPDQKLLDISRTTLYTLINLQGKQINIESGEEPGKFIHEFRKENFDRFLELEKPWFIYPDQTIRNFDSLDSTPLALIAIYKYWEASKKSDKEFLINALPAVEAGLNWIITYGDRDKDYFLEYDFPKERKHGGSLIQSWTDSSETLVTIKGQIPKYPIAPVEIQGYAWLALSLWGDFYLKHSPSFGKKLLAQADTLRERFNQFFVFKDKGFYYAAQALDGNKSPIKTVTANPLLLLWASYEKGGKRKSIVHDEYIKDFVFRGFLPDLFDERAGIRTMSTQSPTFINSNDSYHNGSFWPMLNGMIYEALVKWKFPDESKILKEASLKPLEYFKSPVELYFVDEGGVYSEFKSSQKRTRVGEEGLSPEVIQGQKIQAWSAAAMLSMLTSQDLTRKFIQPFVRRKNSLIKLLSY